MLLGIDHMVIATADPDEAVETLARELGMAAGGGGAHPRWGTRNRLLWFGDTFVDLLGITDEGLAAGSWLGAPALAALATEPGLVGWAIATDNLEVDAAVLRDAGAGLGPAIDGERRRPDGATVRWRLALPRTIGLRHPFLIEHEPGSAEWTDADRRTRAAVPGRIAELRVPVDRIYGLTLGARDHAVLLGQQRVVRASTGPPTLRVTGLGRARHLSMYGCGWSLA